MVDQRDLPSITRFDGNLAGLHVRSPVARTSATRLERWVACPFGYFVQDLLRVEPVEDPEEALRISPLDKGNLVHNALERFILEVLDGTLTTPAPDEPWSATHHGRLRELGEEIGADFEARGLTGRALFWRQDRRALLADLAKRGGRLFFTHDPGCALARVALGEKGEAGPVEPLETLDKLPA